MEVLLAALGVQAVPEHCKSNKSMFAILKTNNSSPTAILKTNNSSPTATCHHAGLNTEAQVTSPRTVVPASPSNSKSHHQETQVTSPRTVVAASPTNSKSHHQQHLRKTKQPNLQIGRFPSSQTNKWISSHCGVMVESPTNSPSMAGPSRAARSRNQSPPSGAAACGSP